MKMNEKLTRGGVFSVTPKREMYGMLTLDGENSSLKLWSWGNSLRGKLQVVKMGHDGHPKVSMIFGEAFLKPFNNAGKQHSLSKSIGVHER